MKLSVTARALKDAVALHDAAVARAYNNSRFKLPTGINHDHDNNKANGNSNGDRVVCVGKKRKKNGDSSEGVGKQIKARDIVNCQSEYNDDTVLWRLNFDELNKRFRHQQCVQLVREKVNPQVNNIFFPSQVY